MTAALPSGPRGRALAAGLCVLVVAIAWLAVVSPLVAWYAEGGIRLERDEVLLGRMESLADAVPALRRQATQAPAAQAPQAALLAGATDAIAGAALQERVSAMAAQAGATLSSTEALPGEADGAYRRISLHVALTAPWPQLVHLIEAIETSPTGMLLNDLQLRSPPAVPGGPAPPLDAGFTVIAFRAAGAP
jgi:general secretion pathway protein M